MNLGYVTNLVSIGLSHNQAQRHQSISHVAAWTSLNAFRASISETEPNTIKQSKESLQYELLASMVEWKQSILIIWFMFTQSCHLCFSYSGLAVRALITLA